MNSDFYFTMIDWSGITSKTSHDQQKQNFLVGEQTTSFHSVNWFYCHLDQQLFGLHSRY